MAVLQSHLVFLVTIADPAGAQEWGLREEERKHAGMWELSASTEPSPWVLLGTGTCSSTPLSQEMPRNSSHALPLLCGRGSPSDGPSVRDSDSPSQLLSRGSPLGPQTPCSTPPPSLLPSPPAPQARPQTTAQCAAPIDPQETVARPLSSETLPVHVAPSSATSSSRGTVTQLVSCHVHVSGASQTPAH